MAHLEGSLVRLRAPETSDADALNDAFSDPAVLAHLEFRFPQPVEGFREFLAFVRQDPTHLLFTIERKEDAVPIGACDLRGVNLFGAPGTGIWIGREHWERGYGSDAMRTLCAHAFLDLGLHRVTLHVYDSNPRAQRVYEKVGFVHEGTMREDIFGEGTWNDVHVMGLLASEFSQKS